MENFDILDTLSDTAELSGANEPMDTEQLEKIFDALYNIRLDTDPTYLQKEFRKAVDHEYDKRVMTDVWYQAWDVYLQNVVDNSVRCRRDYHIIKKYGDFVINNNYNPTSEERYKENVLRIILKIEGEDFGKMFEKFTRRIADRFNRLGSWNPVTMIRPAYSISPPRHQQCFKLINIDV